MKIFSDLHTTTSWICTLCFHSPWSALPLLPHYLWVAFLDLDHPSHLYQESTNLPVRTFVTLFHVTHHAVFTWLLFLSHQHSGWHRWSNKFICKKIIYFIVSLWWIYYHLAPVTISSSYFISGTIPRNEDIIMQSLDSLEACILVGEMGWKGKQQNK